MTTTTLVDPRVAELEALAQEEGITLPYPADYIAFLEEHGRMVDLQTGEVLYVLPIAVPTLAARSIVHLLGGTTGEFTI